MNQVETAVVEGTIVILVRDRKYFVWSIWDFARDSQKTNKRLGMNLTSLDGLSKEESKPKKIRCVSYLIVRTHLEVSCTNGKRGAD